ncbi:MAG: hypothetical protein J2P41_15895 [Blastocatellia bacterium]|nr:hypothetical protein [Blastocatellia bacterium]
MEKSEAKSSGISEVIGHLESGEARLEVVLCECAGESRIALQLSTWHESLGWQKQKTIPFPADKIGQLQRLLCRTRNRIQERRMTVVGAGAQVIEFATCEAGSQAEPPATPSNLQPDEVKTAVN